MDSAQLRSVLVIGATGRVGQAVLRALQASTPAVPTHAFVRTPANLPADLSERCASVTAGDARDARAVQTALEKVEATDVVLCTGTAKALEKTDVRGVTGRALADAVTARRTASGTGTRVAVVSCVGAGDSTIRLKWGMGALMGLYLHRVIKDHNAQEVALKDAFEDCAKDLLIVRPTGLKDGARTGGVKVYGDKDVLKPSVMRADVAEWIASQICGAGDSFGKAVVLSSSG